MALGLIISNETILYFLSLVSQFFLFHSNIVRLFTFIHFNEFELDPIEALRRLRVSWDYARLCINFQFNLKYQKWLSRKTLLWKFHFYMFNRYPICLRGFVCSYSELFYQNRQDFLNNQYFRAFNFLCVKQKMQIITDFVIKKFRKTFYIKSATFRLVWCTQWNKGNKWFSVFTYDT